MQPNSQYMQEQPQAPATNACNACRHGKRRCDRKHPSCSTCSRVGRNCVYEEAPLQQLAFDASGRTMPSGSSSALPNPPHLPPASPLAAEAASGGTLTDTLASIDPFRREPLTRPAVDAIVTKELLRITGSHDRLVEIVDAYFSSISRRIPILSAKRCYERLPGALSPGADFAALCLCMYLVLDVPQPGDAGMQTALYVAVKGVLSLLEATSHQSLEVIQCRVLVAFYEIGHGVYPAAAVSVGACAKLARLAGIHRDTPLLGDGELRDILVEERRRTWWAVHNLDRYVNLCLEDSLFAVPFAQGTDPLPTEESLWSQNIAPSPVVHSLNTPSDVTIGSFARECQICHLVGRVLRNVYEPTPDASFQMEEASRIEATMLAFIPLLREDGADFGKYCISFAICSSALFTLYGSALDSRQLAPAIQARRLSLIEDTSLQVTQYCRRLFGVEEDINYGGLSPLVPYAVYQTAVVQDQLRRQTGEMAYEDNLDFMREVLRRFNKRWAVAGKYLRRLEAHSPPLLLPPI